MTDTDGRGVRLPTWVGNSSTTAAFLNHFVVRYSLDLHGAICRSAIYCASSVEAIFASDQTPR